MPEFKMQKILYSRSSKGQNILDLISKIENIFEFERFLILVRACSCVRMSRSGLRLI